MTDTPTPAYVYGIVDTTAELPDLPGLCGAPLDTVRVDDGIAAVVSDLPAPRPLGHRAELRSHEQVLDALVTGGVPVLPMRFGAVLADREAVAVELLGAHHDELQAALDRVRGRSEYVLSGRYEEAVLREIAEENPQVRGLRGAGGMAQLMRLGEAVVVAMQRKRAVDGARVLEPLMGYATDLHERELSEPDQVVDVALLVDNARAAEFLAGAEDVAATYAGRIRLRLLGPVAPYDFVPVAG